MKCLNIEVEVLKQVLCTIQLTYSRWIHLQTSSEFLFVFVSVSSYLANKISSHPIMKFLFPKLLGTKCRNHLFLNSICIFLLLRIINRPAKFLRVNILKIVWIRKYLLEENESHFLILRIRMHLHCINCYLCGTNENFISYLVLPVFPICMIVGLPDVTHYFTSTLLTVVIQNMLRSLALLKSWTSEKVRMWYSDRNLFAIFYGLY